MSSHYVAVNESKRMYVDPSVFADNPKFGGTYRGNHGIALCLLLCRHRDNPPVNDDLQGSWCGDEVRYYDIENDEVMHDRIRGTYRNVSYDALIMLMEWFSDIQAEYVAAALKDEWVMYCLGRAAESNKGNHASIDMFFSDHDVPDWRERYESVKKIFEQKESPNQAL